jgi:hypothetical protein
MNQGKLTIEMNVSEQRLMEHCLNLRHSGYDPMIILSFHALAHHWHINKFTYYMRLLKE